MTEATAAKIVTTIAVTAAKTATIDAADPVYCGGSFPDALRLRNDLQLGASIPSRIATSAITTNRITATGQSRGAPTAISSIGSARDAGSI
jgi:hypothetical protein